MNINIHFNNCYRFRVYENQTLYYLYFSVPDCRFNISWISRECADIPLSHSYNYKVKGLIIDSLPLLHFFHFSTDN